MPSFIVRSRKTNAIVEATVTANTREDAIAQVVHSAAAGEEIEVMGAVELPAGATGATGTTGATGATGTTGGTGPTGTGMF